MRLNLITAKAPKGKLPLNGYQYLTERPRAQGERVCISKRGDGIKFEKKQAEEGSQKLILYSWEVVHCAPPNKIYIAVFTWTTLASQDREPKFKSEIRLINGEISKAYFHPDLLEQQIG